jgi:hypothetical protein
VSKPNALGCQTPNSLGEEADTLRGALEARIMQRCVAPMRPVSVGKFEPAQRVGQTAEGCDFLKLTKVVNQPIRQPGQSQGLG